MAKDKTQLIKDLTALMKESKTTPMTEEDYAKKLATAIDDHFNENFKHTHVDSQGGKTSEAIHD